MPYYTNMLQSSSECGVTTMRKSICLRAVRFGRVLPIFVAGSSLAACEGPVRPLDRGTHDAGIAGSAAAPGAMSEATSNVDSGGAGSPTPGETPPAIDALDPNSTTAGQSGAPVEPNASSDAGVSGPVCVPTGPRDCASELDNDCDGQPDNVLDDVCRCTLGAVEACDEHPGFDGLGLCTAGTRTCIVTADAGSSSSDWGACEGAIGPGAADSCDVRGDDTDCDGLPNEGCTCVEGEPLQCGSSTDVGVCAFGSTTCVNGAFGQCIGAIPPAARDSCVRGDDSNCNGIANEGCACIDGETRPCGPPAIGICRGGVQTCVNGVFSAECVGAVQAAARNCNSTADNDCDGQPDNTIDNVCQCAIGSSQACGTHPQDGVGSCRAGSQQCVPGPNNASSAFSPTCTGSVGPGPRNCGSASDNDCDGEPDNTIDNVCECNPGQGNGACSDDPSNSRCNGQGQCVPCQTDADCSLVSGGRSQCGGGECFASEAIVGWRIRGDSPTLPATTGVPGVTGSDMTKANAFSAVAALQDTFGAVDWPREGLDLRRYFEFGVTANPGSSVTFDHLEFSISSSNSDDGSADWQIRTSVDSFASSIAQGSVSELALPGTPVTPNVSALGTRTGTVTFRLYIFNLASDEFPAVGIRGSNGAAASSLLIFGGVN